MEDKYSPCVENCLVDYETGICTGCFRTVDEISQWINYSDDKKIKILSCIEERKNDYMINKK